MGSDGSNSSSPYGSIAQYFSQSGTQSAGKSGGAGQSNTASQSAGGSGSGTQGGNASSGSNSWLSLAASVTSDDHSAFTTAQSFFAGGITNNQIVDSPGATGATNAAPSVTPAAAGGATSALTSGGGALMYLALFGIAVLVFMTRRG